MKKYISSLSFIVLMGVLLMTACGANTSPTTTAMNSPAVTATLPATEVVIKDSETIPAETQALTATTEPPALTNTPTSNLPQTDDEWQAFITEKLQGHHSLNFLLSQNLSEQEWLNVLAKRSHADVVLTDEEMAAMIQWLMAN
jgi:hypothetical protein